MTVRALATASFLAALTLTLPACRTETGFGRGSSMRSTSWAAGQMSSRFFAGWEQTLESLTAIPQVTERNTVNSFSALERTWSLYRYGSPKSPDPSLGRSHAITKPTPGKRGRTEEE